MTDTPNAPPDLSAMTPGARENFTRLSFDMATFVGSAPPKSPEPVRNADGTFTPAPPTAEQMDKYRPSYDYGRLASVTPEDALAVHRSVVEFQVALDLPPNVSRDFIDHVTERSRKLSAMSELDRTLLVQQEKSFYSDGELALAVKAVTRAKDTKFLKDLVAINPAAWSPWAIKTLAAFEARRPA